MRAMPLLFALSGACSFEPGMLPGAIDASDGGDVDTDGDTIINRLDNCPDAKNMDQRDWDGDMRGDVCDRCPHLASASDPDADGDNVGDACDPRPAAAGDQRVIWLGFYDPADIVGWSTSNTPGMWSVVDHELVQSEPTFALLDSPQQYGDVYFATRLEAVTAQATEVGVCGSDIPIGQQYYCCGVTSAGSNSVRAVSYWATSGGQRFDPQPFAGNLDPGATVDIVATMTPTESQCSFVQGLVSVQSATPRGPVTPGTAVFFATAPVRYHYGFVVKIGT